MADHGVEILFGLFTVFVAAQVGAEIAQRLKLPAVVGEISAGCAIGPHALNWVKINEPMEVLSELGAVLLLFSVGLETRIGDLKRVGKAALLVGIAGVILPFILGLAWAVPNGFKFAQAAFIAAAFVATSAGITARVLQDLGALRTTAARVILGAAVIDDILAMLLLGVVTALQGGGGINVGGLLLVLAQAIGFVVIIALVGTRLMQRGSSMLDAPINPLSPLTLCLAGCLGLAAASAKLGLAAIIGAFLAGTIAAESKQRHTLEHQIQPLLAFLVPFFFVVTGTHVDLGQLKDPGLIAATLVVTVLAVLGKLIGCGVGALSLGKARALIVGVGMVPRGEVGIIVASLGKAAGAFQASTYAMIILMSLITSIVAPPVLKTLIARAPEDEPVEGVQPPDENDEPSELIAVEETGHHRPSS